MRTLLLGFHALVELTVGAVMWARPAWFLGAPPPEMVDLARAFGSGAGAVGLLSLLLIRRPEADRVALPTLALYQLGIGINQVLSPMPGVPPWVPPVFHLGLVAGFVALWVRGR
jgi:hypothetical protein